MKWIPVKDRLPEVSKMVYEGSKWMQPIGFADYFLLSDWVLVTADADSSDGDDTEIFVAQYEDDLDGRTYWTTIGAGLLNNVTAWMPLPQPYKADHKTENSSEKPNNCEAKNYCDDCLYTDTCDSKEFFYACTSKATISKMEQVEDEPQTDDDAYFLKLMGAVERGEISDAGANQAWYEYINHKPQTERKDK